MNRLNLLLGISERRISNLIEILVHDVCFDQATVNSIKTSRVDELIFRGSCDETDLIVMAPDNLLVGSNQRPARGSMAEALSAIRLIKSQRMVPLITVAVSPEQELPLLEAGADSAFASFFDQEAFKTEVRRVMRLPEKVEIPAASYSRWSMAGLWMRGLHWLNQSKIKV
jgi:hypothetical protein